MYLNLPTFSFFPFALLDSRTSTFLAFVTVVTDRPRKMGMGLLSSGSGSAFSLSHFPEKQMIS